MNYEIEFVFLGREKAMVNLFCTLTGLPEEEMSPLVKNRMKGQRFIEIFRQLGFNTNNRFVKFDRQTKYPVVLRCCNHEKGVWFPFVYYNNRIFDICHNAVMNLDDPYNVSQQNGKYFLKLYGMKITSMLQVWI